MTPTHELYRASGDGYRAACRLCPYVTAEGSRPAIAARIAAHVVDEHDVEPDPVR